MKSLFRISGVILFVLSIFLIHSCKKDKPTPPIITTTAVTEISYTTASSGGDVTNEGGAPILSKGICWNTLDNPTIANSKTSDGTGTESFTSNITQLTPNTKYYVRAYATNAVGTGYGSQVTFTTTQIAVPVLTTTAITSITSTTAFSGGNITTDNGGSVTTRGVCWGTAINPTTSNDKTTDGTEAGNFVSNLTSLQPGTIYYVRAYATNSVGTSYGNEVSFTTLAELSTITTSTITGITPTTAISGGNITSDGGATISARGVCWSTNQNPTIADNKTTDGTGTGSFVSNLIGLQPGTIYYVKSYATNSVGTAYSSQVNFTTYTGTVTDIDGNIYNTVKIGNQIWMAENLKTTKYSDGTSISLVRIEYEWSNCTTGAYCDYGNLTSNSAIYGKLYNWHAAHDSRNIAPTGWHVPTDSEWSTLTTYLGGESVAGGKLKETGTTHWQSPNIGATNESGFTALPGGSRFEFNGLFYSIGDYGYWWSSTEFNTLNAWGWAMDSNYSSASRSGVSKQNGYSVRCIKD